MPSAKALELLDDNDEIIFEAALEYLEQMGADVGDAAPDQSFYDKWAKLGLGVFTPILWIVLMDGAIGTANSFPGHDIFTDDFIENQAATFADSYTFDLIKGITDTTQKALQKIFSEAMEQGLGDDIIAEKLLPFFGERRAKLIAINESTRVWNEGAELAADQLRSEGLELATIWRTINDSRVDDICRTYEGQPRGTAWNNLPPAHIGCRCFVTHEVLRDDDTG